MANPTQNDTLVPPNVWTSVLGALDPAQPLVIQNVGVVPVRVAVGDAAPATAEHGIVLRPGEVRVFTTTAGIWVWHAARFPSPVNVSQEG